MIMARPRKYESIVEDLEEDAPEKACISCRYNIRIPDKDNMPMIKENRCAVDNHYIGYLDNWNCTCRYHQLEK